MKKAHKSKREQEMLGEYGFRKGVRGKHADRYAKGSNVVVLSPELSALFPDSASVNKTLQALVNLARQSTKRKAD